MFQTEPIHALQSLASDSMTAFMVGVTSLGYTWALIPILLVIAFGFDFRRGMVLVQIVIWNGLLTNLLKATFALPRPEAVDSTLLQPGDDLPETTPFTRMGAASFWGGLPTEVVTYHRGLGELANGFPSGHTSVTTALWLSVAALFRRGTLWLWAAVLIVLMALSRMYLARHFLADVLGGFALGLTVFGVAWAIAVRPLAEPGTPSILERITLRPDALRALLYLGAPLAMMLIPGADVENLMRLLGINLGLWLLTRDGLPLDGGTPGMRVTRVLLAFALYGVTDPLLSSVVESALGERRALEYGIQALSSFLLVWGAPRICYRIGLYQRGAPGVGLLG